jgi:hypothetical protein
VEAQQSEAGGDMHHVPDAVGEAEP